MAARIKEPPKEDAAMEFVWNSCSYMDPQLRVRIKQQALDDGLYFAEKVLSAMPRKTSRKMHKLAGLKIFKLLDEAAQLRQRNRNFKVLVGVRGVTGAGKSSIFNCLLGMSILPVSFQEASTATVCRISWNYDDDPKKSFRAKAYFLSLEDATKDIAGLLNAIKRRRELSQNIFGDSTEMNEDNSAELDDLCCQIEEGISKWRDVWPVDDMDLEAEDISAEKIINSKPAVAKLLGTTVEVTSSEVEDFAERIKPYLDNTPTTDFMIVWPLIQEVNVFVKSEILRYSIDLVDLPGSSDGVSSRAEVGRKYSEKLDQTIIVLPALRAVDEKAGVTLMSGYQELEMKLTGKFHRNSFCVVISKIDDMVNDEYIRTSLDARQDQTLQGYIAEEKKLRTELVNVRGSLQSCRTEIASLDRLLSEQRAEDTKLRANLSSSVYRDDDVDGDDDEYEDRDQFSRASNRKHLGRLRKAHKTTVRKRDQQLENQEAKEGQEVKIVNHLESLDRQKTHRCIWLRNKYLEKRIVADFARRQKKLTANIPRLPRYDGSVDVFPVSARAYQDIQNPGPTHRGNFPSFPSKLYTGIPRLRQWIEENTCEERDTHLDSQLASLNRILMDINNWCDEQPGGKVKFPREEVTEVLDSTCRVYGKLQDKKDMISDRVKVARQVAQDWVKKFPSGPQSYLRMAHGTYTAILSRDGGPYFSKASGVLYHWPEVLSAALLDPFSEKWIDLFDIQIPKDTKQHCKDITSIWGKLLGELADKIKTTAPQLFTHFQAAFLELEDISNEFNTRLKLEVTEMCKASRGSHCVFSSSLQDQLRSIYRSALQYRGSGSFERRQKHIVSKVESHCEGMFSAAWERMYKTQVEESAKLHEKLQQISSDMVLAAMTKIAIILENLEVVRKKDQKVIDEKMRLRANVSRLTLEWAARWRVPEQSFPDTVEAKLGIPEDLIPSQTG
ncbi:hypothetical protein V8F20_003400 [Naviculisporaceae sp. PSN 640]